MSSEPTPPVRPTSTQQSVSGGPRIEITPSPEQYTQLCRDLGTLRRAGAISNTAAVVSAVRAAAAQLDGNSLT
jgi:hypothetical protein